MALKHIISGGQTGADQAALDAAIKYKFPHGGWIPKGRKTEDGRLPDNYRLKEMLNGGRATVTIRYNDKYLKNTRFKRA